MPTYIVKLDNGQTVRVRADEPAPGQKSSGGPSSPSRKILGMDAGTVSNVARNTLEGGGMVAGGLLGSSLGPAGSVGGGIAGYGLGRETANLLDEKLGLRNPPATLKDIGQTLGQDLSQGALNESLGLGIEHAALPLVKKAVSGVAQKLKPDITPEQAQRIALAHQTGMPVTPADVRQSKGISQLEAWLSRTPGSAGTMENFQKGQEARFQNLLAPVAKGASPDLAQSGRELVDMLSAPQAQAVNAIQRRVGSQAPPSEIGGRVQEALNRNKEAAAQVAKGLYDQAGESLKGQKHIPENLINAATQHLSEIEHLPDADSTLLHQLRGYSKVPEPAVPPDIRKFLDDPAQPDPLKQTIRKEMGLEPGYTWRDLQSMRARIGDRIEEEKASSGVQGMKASGSFSTTDTGRRLLDLKNALTKDMEDFAGKSPEAWKSYQEANRLFSLAAKAYKNPLARKTLSSDPEKVADHWIQPKNVSRVAKAQQTLGENGFAPLRQAFGQKIVGTPDHPASPDQIRKTLDKYSRPVIEKVYGKPTTDWLFDQADKATLNPIQKKAANSEPASLFTSLLKPGNVKSMAVQDSKNLSNILHVRRVTGPAGVDNLRTQWLAHILSEPKEGGPLTAKQFSDRASAYGSKTLSALFPDRADLTKIKNLIELGKIVKGGERVVSNPSRTSDVMMIALTGGEATGAVMEAASGHFGKAALLGGSILLPKGIAKLYLSKAGRKLLAEGYRMKPDNPKAATLIQQIKNITGSQNIIPLGAKTGLIGSMNSERKKRHGS